MRPPQGNYGVGTKANWENKHHLLNLLLIWTFSFLLWLPLVAYKQGEWGWGRTGQRLAGRGDPHVFTRVRFCSRNDREEVGLNHSKNLTPTPSLIIVTPAPPLLLHREHARLQVQGQKQSFGRARGCVLGESGGKSHGKQSRSRHPCLRVTVDREKEKQSKSTNTV